MTEIASTSTEHPSPIQPYTYVVNAYRLVSYWKPIGGTQTDPIIAAHGSLGAAERDGMYLGCLNGCLRVEVFNPDHELECLWDKQAEGFADDGVTPLASVWRRVGPEAQQAEEIAFTVTLAPVIEHDLDGDEG